MGKAEPVVHAGLAARLRAQTRVVHALAGCPLCLDVRAEEPVCGYYAATFERIFRALVSPRARARETACAASGAPACTFVVEW